MRAAILATLSGTFRHQGDEVVVLDRSIVYCGKFLMFKTDVVDGCGQCMDGWD